MLTRCARSQENLHAIKWLLLLLLCVSYVLTISMNRTKVATGGLFYYQKQEKKHVNSKSDVTRWWRRNPLRPERRFQPQSAEYRSVGNGPERFLETGRGGVRDERKREDHFPLRTPGTTVGITEAL